MGFDEVRFSDRIARGSRGGPGFLTEVVEVASGHERRNQVWAQARCRFEARTGVRSQADLAELIGFFRARRGRARGFRFRDWSDYTSTATGDRVEAVTAVDQVIGSGDGVETAFQLVKSYEAGAFMRDIVKPVAASVMVALDGVAQGAGWAVDTATGVVTFDVAPSVGVVVSAGFVFDVPVRFDTDRLSVRLEAYRSGEAEVPLVEIRQ